MDIVVCIKQVPEASDISWDNETGSLIRESASGILNPNDKNAVEAALGLKEKHGGIITAVSMGPEQAEESLREVLSMGVDRAVLLSDKKFAGADTLATAYTLGQSIKKIGVPDIILCGKESADGMTAHVGPQIAEFMNMPQITCAIEIEIKDSFIRAKQKLDNGYRVLESPMPLVITVEREINQPRMTSMELILEAYSNKEVIIWNAEDLEFSVELFGLKGSPTKTVKVYKQKVTRGKVKILPGNTESAAMEFVEILKEKSLI